MRAAIAAAVLALCAALPARAQEPARNEKLHALFERELKQRMEESPEFATILGIPGYDERLSDASPAAVARRKAHVPALIAELEAFNGVALSTQDRISRDVLLDQLEISRAFNELYGDLPFG